MTLIRVSMIIDSSRFAKMLDLLSPEDALSIGIMEVNKPPPAIERRPIPRSYPMKSRPTRKPKIKRGQTARAFILDFAKRNGPFNVRKDLAPRGEIEGFASRTMHVMCAKLAGEGFLIRTGVGNYQFDAPAEPVEVEVPA